MKARIHLEYPFSDTVWQRYRKAAEFSQFSYQSKKILTKEELCQILENPSYQKVTFHDASDAVVAAMLCVDDCDLVPDSHYEREYFRHKETPTTFVIGDLFGVIPFQDQTVSLQYASGLYTALRGCLRACGHGERRIVNSSSMRALQRAGSIASPAGSQTPRLSPHFEILDEEVFTNIVFDATSTRTRLAIKTLRGVGAMMRYRIVRREQLSTSEQDEIANLYESRLRPLARRSPQLLRYDRSTFIDYLRDPLMQKYVLFRRQQIAGVSILIPSTAAHRATWVNPGNRDFDAYVKIVFTRKGVRAYGYLCLFAVSFELMRKELGVQSIRILADWSRNLNGKIFRSRVKSSHSRRPTISLPSQVLDRDIILSQGPPRRSSAKRMSSH